MQKEPNVGNKTNRCHMSQILTRENSYPTNFQATSNSVSDERATDEKAVFHYSDIKNRTFGTKFIDGFKDQQKRQETIEESVIIQNDKPQLHDISFSEEIVGSENTIHSGRQYSHIRCHLHSCGFNSV